MSDTSLNKIIQYGTTAARIAFVPNPAAGSQVLYIWFDTDNAPDTYVWDGAAWVQINSTAGFGTGDVVGPAVAVNGQIAIFDGTTGKLIADGGDTIADVIAAAIAGASDTGITELTGDVTAGPGSGSQAAVVKAAIRTQQIGVTIDGGGAVLTTGPKGFKSFMVAGTIIRWRLMADQAGSVEFDVFKDAYAGWPPTTSIVAASPPKIVADSTAEDTVLSGWDTTVNAGDVFAFEIISASGIQRVTLELTIVVD